MTDGRTAYKLVDSDGYSRRGLSGETLWTVGSTVRPTGEGSGPCGPGVLHAYVSPEVAVLGNPVHAQITDPRCLLIESGREWRTDGLKRWTTGACRVIEEVALPPLTTEERVAWVIVLSPHASTRDWAARWLSGEDRSVEAAKAAKAASAPRAAAWAAEAAVWAAWAWAAAWAAEAASWAAAWAAADAPWAAADAPWAAADAPDAAAYEPRLMPALRRARAILAGECPAERYDEELSDD